MSLNTIYIKLRLKIKISSNIHMQISSPKIIIFNSNNSTENETISEITGHNNLIIKPSLTVELQQTIFDNIKLNESPNSLKIKKLMSSNLINNTEKRNN